MVIERTVGRKVERRLPKLVLQIALGVNMVVPPVHLVQLSDDEVAVGFDLLSARSKSCAKNVALLVPNFKTFASPELKFYLCIFLSCGDAHCAYCTPHLACAHNGY